MTEEKLLRVIDKTLSLSKRVAWNKGKKVSEETRRKISIALSKRLVSEETKRRMSLAHKGKGHVCTEEVRKRISETKKGTVPWNKGKIGVTEETRIKMSMAKKGKAPHNKGIKYGDDIRKKMSAAQMGRIPWNKGKVGVTEDTRQKMREARSKVMSTFKFTKPERITYGYLDSIIGEEKYKKHYIIKGLLPFPYMFHPFDAVLEEEKVVIEVQGCYYHACSICFPKLNKWQVRQKFKDMKIKEYTEKNGWKMIYLWEHEIEGTSAYGIYQRNSHKEVKCDTCNGTGHTLRFTDYDVTEADD